MLTLLRQNGGIAVAAPAYRLTAAPDRPFVYLDDAQGRRAAELFVLSGVHTTSGQDDTVEIGSWDADEQADRITLSLTASSSVWKSKRYTFECLPDRFRYWITVEGGAPITDADYFGGYSSAHLRWGSGFFWSGQQFLQGFNPEPNGSEVYEFPAAGDSAIDLTGVPLPARADWFFTPPPFCYAVQTQAGWLGIGVEARPGHNRFTEYRYHGQRGAFYLSLTYEGYTQVHDTYTLPAIGFDFASSPYHALEQHTAALVRHGCVTLPLAAHDLAPGMVVLDDKWQATYGDNRVDPGKWPDLKGFIARQHATGRKVLLWLKGWDPEGIPVEECITNAAGRPVAVDPTHPGFERRLRESIHVMLCDYDADGFKLDFTARIPSGPGMRLAGDAWGLELMRAYLAILHDEAKRAKPDALVMAHTPNPYLAGVVDMIRLNDVNTGTDVNCAMSHRARVASIACPGAIIDTDNWPMTDRDTWRAYIRLQADLGVPSLYCTTHIDTTGEPLTEDDYRLIRETWAAWRAKLHLGSMVPVQSGVNH